MFFPTGWAFPTCKIEPLPSGDGNSGDFLFGLETSMPESIATAQRRLLICFAWATWTYRFLLFLGIALMVYHYFFKLLGLILFAVEIGWFIVLPIMGELKIWWALRGEIVERRRGWLSAGVLACVIAVLFVPWSDRISLPAVLEATPHATIYGRRRLGGSSNCQ